MEREWLAQRLAAGESIEAIGRAVGRHPSTVAYWVNKHGLVSAHADRHRARGGLARSLLADLVERGLSVREIAHEGERSPSAVRHWLRRYGLKTQPARYAPRDEPALRRILRHCERHGWIEFARVGTGSFRCPQCVAEADSERRRELKRILVEEADGRCALCGYDRCVAALHFHHADPGFKEYSLSAGGVVRSLSRLRLEARKCVLLCANCHAEVEAGLEPAPLPADHPG